MAERKYSVAEIDSMRRYVETLTIRSGKSYQIGEANALVEDRLRTYMQNGTAPEELAEASSAELRRQQENYRYEQQLRQRPPSPRILPHT